MRIGILTFHRSINYGAFMQAYAMSNELQNRYGGSTVEIIDFDYAFKNARYRQKAVGVVGTVLGFRKQYNAFQKDLQELALSKDSLVTDDTNRVREYLQRNYDIIIVGSDAVWAFQKLPLKNPYWLFGKDLDVIKCSYAASAFTTEFERVTTEEREYIADCLSSFSYIGVRDAATQGFVSSLGLGKEVNLNHDPTFFLKPAQDRARAEEVYRRNGLEKGQKYIMMMSRFFPYIDELERYLGAEYKLLFVHRRNNQRSDFFKVGRKFVADLSPLDWYNLFPLMELNLQYYFHGALVGMVNGVPTLAIDDSTNSYRSKYSQVFADLGLHDNIIMKKDLDKDAYFAKIDYLLHHKDDEQARIMKGFEKERQKSASFFDFLDSVIK